jgi:competence protein ComEC
LLVDPLLVHSLGFRLSVAACVGIVVLSPRVGRALPGPRWLREPIAVTVAAQVGVAPVAIPAFGALPLVALPANFLAAPVAGLVTAWGMSGGLVAGVVPPLAPVLHLPTRLATAWVAGVARVGAALPVPWLGGWPSLAIPVVVSAVLLARRSGSGRGVGSAGAPAPRRTAP